MLGGAALFDKRNILFVVLTKRRLVLKKVRNLIPVDECFFVGRESLMSLAKKTKSILIIIIIVSSLLCSG